MYYSEHSKWFSENTALIYFCIVSAVWDYLLSRPWSEVAQRPKVFSGTFTPSSDFSLENSIFSYYGDCFAILFEIKWNYSSVTGRVSGFVFTICLQRTECLLQSCELQPGFLEDMVLHCLANNCGGGDAYISIHLFFLLLMLVTS